MANSKIYILLFLLSLSVLSCKHEPAPPERMIVEGWIDKDGFPFVILHRSYVFAEHENNDGTIEDVIKNQMVIFGRVVISDGEREVVLTGRVDTNFMPPYVYTTAEMKGEVGKEYFLTATYGDLSATASTTILPPKTIDSITVQEDEKGRMNVVMHLSGFSQDSMSYYAVFVRQLPSRQFYFAPISNFDNSKATAGSLKINVYDPFSSAQIETLSMFKPFPKDTSNVYQIKLARIDRDAYSFWEDYANQSVMQGMFYVPVYTNMRSNISGGYGVWTGMGGMNCFIKTAKDTTSIP